MKVSVVVGGQFGSEAKGAVTAALTRAILAAGQVPQVVRVAGPNAGHTAYDDDGTAWALRTVPVGLVVNRDVRGHIAAGSELDLPVLFDELDRLNAAGLDIDSRLTIDPSVTMLTQRHHTDEADALLTARVGSTGKGIGAARAARIMRIASTLTDLLRHPNPLAQLRAMYPAWYARHDTAQLRAFLMRLDWMAATPNYYDADHLVIEGTQGYGLGLHTKFYPQCTSSDTTAGAFLAMAGVTPWAHRVDHVSVLVCARVYPIRVAGNSGPLAGETSWAELGLPEELTTVTKKVRRVGAWDPELIEDALAANGATSRDLTRDRVFLALTMFDQSHPQYANLDTYGDPVEQAAALHAAREFCRYPITYLGTGPNSYLWSGLLGEILGVEA